MPKRSRAESVNAASHRPNKAFKHISGQRDIDKSSRKALNKGLDSHNNAETSSTPHRLSGSHHSAGSHSTTKSEIKNLLAPELVDRRILCQDLVHDAFGDMIPPQLARQLVKGLLTCNLLQVRRKDGQAQENEDRNTLYEAASAEAMDAAEAARKGESVEEDNFEWSWATGHCKSEEQGSEFLNTVAVTCIAVLAAGECQNYSHLEERLGSSCCFARNPIVHHPLPLSDPMERQDIRPDILNLVHSAFTTQIDQNRSSDFRSRTEEVVKAHSYYQLPQEQESPNNPNRPHKGKPAAPENAYWTWLEDDKSRVFMDLAYANCTQNRIAIEIKHTDINEGIRAAHIYMRGLRKAQPWLCRTLGLAMTDKTFCLLRGDPSGVEECSLERCSSRGALDVVRIALGFVLANDAEFGIDGAFELMEKRWKYVVRGEKRFAKTKPPESPTPKSNKSKKGIDKQALTSGVGEKSGATKTLKTDKKRRIFKPRPHENGDKTTSTREERGIEYCMRFPVAVNLEKGGITRRFLTDYLLYDSGSLAGRTTRVWCVAEDGDHLDEGDGGDEAEDESDEVALDDLDEDIKVVVTSPDRRRALRLSWPDVKRAETVRAVFKKIGHNIKNLIVPIENNEWNGGRVLEMRKMPSPLPKKIKIEDREKQWCLTDLMRPLCQFKNLDEVVDVMIGFLQILIDLDEQDVLQRDVSDANILLTPDGSGALSDMDMAAFKTNTLAKPNLSTSNPFTSKPKVTKTTGKTIGPLAFDGKAFRTGTPAYMSWGVLTGLTHILRYDVESVFYTLFLFFFTYNGPSTTPFPEKPEPQYQLLPETITEWASGTSFERMAAAKKQFFSVPRNVAEPLDKLPQYWEEKRTEVMQLIERAYNVVWIPGSPNDPERNLNTRLTPQKLQEALRSWKVAKTQGFPELAEADVSREESEEESEGSDSRSEIDSE